MYSLRFLTMRFVTSEFPLELVLFSELMISLTSFIFTRGNFMSSSTLSTIDLKILQALKFVYGTSLRILSVFLSKKSAYRSAISFAEVIGRI